MQIKTPMRYLLTQVRMTNIKKKINKKCPFDSPPGQLVLMALEVYDMIFTFCFLFLGRASPGPNIEEGKCLEALCPPVVYLFYCSKLHWCLPLLSADSNALISFMVNLIIPFSTPQRLSQ